MKVLISDATARVCADILTDKGITVVEKPEITPEDLEKEISEYAGLIVRSRTKVTPNIIRAGTSLKVIGRAGAGVDNIDTAVAKDNGIYVMNTPGANTNAVAELAIGYMFALARHIPRATQSLRDGQWEKKKLSGTEVFEKTLGLLGYGKIGSQVAKKALALGMDVICYDPILTETGKNADGVTVTSMDEVIQQSDYLSIHVPKLESTTNLVDAEMLKRMKKSAYLINCARGGIINEADLVAALDAGEIAGAALDVFAEEPLTDYQLFEHPAIIGSPHIGASTKEAQINVAIMIAHQVADYLNGAEARNVVNK